MNYFEFYEIPISFQLDEAVLKRKFYTNSKKYHPDFYTLASEEEQAKVLDLSSLNNEAYQVLSDFDKRMKYILELKEVLGEEGTNQLPQTFLMEMMDINEGLMELEFDFEETKLLAIQTSLKKLEAEIFTEIEPLINTFDETQLDRIKKYYLKKRYLLRIQENLSKFASR